MFSQTEFKQVPELLWKAFDAKCSKAKHVSRSTFLELAELVATKVQKSYGALDTSRRTGAKSSASFERAASRCLRSSTSYAALTSSRTWMSKLQASCGRRSPTW